MEYDTTKYIETLKEVQSNLDKSLLSCKELPTFIRWKSEIKIGNALVHINRELRRELKR